MKLEHFRSNTPDRHGVPDEVYYAVASENKDRIYNPDNNGSFEMLLKEALHHRRLYAPVTIVYPDGHTIVQEFIDND